MDPSQNNSFGGFGSPGGLSNPGGTGGFGGPSSFGGGAQSGGNPFGNGTPSSGSPFGSSSASDRGGPFGRSGVQSSANPFASTTNTTNPGQQIMSSASQPAASAPGDIVLGGNKSKSKKKLIIAIVAVVALLAVGGGVAAVVLLNSQNTKNVATKKGGFADYKELVLYNDTNGTYPTQEGLYAIEDVVNWTSEDEVLNYFGEISVLETNIDWQTYPSAEIISLWMKIFSFYRHYNNDLVMVFENSGYGDAENMINQKYAKFVGSNNNAVKQNAMIMVEAETEYLNYVELFESNGCKILGVLGDCINRSEAISSAQLDESNRLSLTAYGNFWSIVRSAVATIVGGNS